MLNTKAPTPSHKPACVAAWSEIPMKEEGVLQKHDITGVEGTVERMVETTVMVVVIAVVTERIRGDSISAELPLRVVRKMKTKKRTNFMAAEAGASRSKVYHNLFHCRYVGSS